MKLLLEHDISGAPVVDGSGQLVGVLSESDVIIKARLRRAGGACRRRGPAPVQGRVLAPSALNHPTCIVWCCWRVPPPPMDLRARLRWQMRCAGQSSLLFFGGGGPGGTSGLGGGVGGSALEKSAVEVRGTGTGASNFQHEGGCGAGGVPGVLCATHYCQLCVRGQHAHMDPSIDMCVC